MPTAAKQKRANPPLNPHTESAPASTSSAASGFHPPLQNKTESFPAPKERCGRAEEGYRHSRLCR